MATEKPLPQGVKLLRQFRGHLGEVLGLAFHPSGQILASGGQDGTAKLWKVDTGELVRSLPADGSAVRSCAFGHAGQTVASAEVSGSVDLWDSTSGKLLRTLKGHAAPVNSIAFHRGGDVLASASEDHTVKLWDAETGSILYNLEGHRDKVRSVAFHPSGDTLATASHDTTLRLWNSVDGKLLHTFEGGPRMFTSVAFHPNGLLAGGNVGGVVDIWDPDTGKLLRSLEGHTSFICSLAVSHDGLLLASAASDRRVCIWRCDTWDLVSVIPTSVSFLGKITFHPQQPLLVTADAGNGVIQLWDLDLNALLDKPSQAASVPRATHYVNAKVVLVGDTGVGKTGLRLVLTGQPYEKTESTPGRHVETFLSTEVDLPDNTKQTREALLWDLAGQPGYRVIHQLHLNEIAVALVVFDARSETDPLAGVRHWERALRVAQQRGTGHAIRMKKFLVVARADRGGNPVGRDRILALIKEFGFEEQFYETSAKEGWQIQDLRNAIERSIRWEDLPIVTSTELFTAIKAFLLEVKKSGRLLAPAQQLYEDFVRLHGDLGKETDPQAQFDMCIGRLENRDLIRRLSFGGYILLQPELLDAYASAMVIAAKDQPDGLGSLAEDVALAGKFFVPQEQKIRDKNQEQLLLFATVEELVSHELALRENAEEGRYLVFPSQFSRDYEDAGEPPGKSAAITFEGPLQSIYSAISVRLGHSGLFETNRVEMWRNAAIFTARAGGKCGLYLQEFGEARGRFVLFFDPQVSDQTRFHFEDFLLAHLHKRAVEGTVEVVRFFVCACGIPVPDAYVKMLRERGQKNFLCPCGKPVPLSEPKDRLGSQFQSKVAEMDKTADRKRDFETFVVSANAETKTYNFASWAGGERVNLAIVFTDVVGATAMEEEIKGASMNEIRRAHFAQSRKLIGQFRGREIKTIGDSFMAAFRSVDAALDYAMGLFAGTGHDKIRIRAGIHVGAMQVEENDVFGSTVNFSARVVGSIEGPEIWLSERAKAEIDDFGAARYQGLKWEPRKVKLKGFSENTLWALANPQTS